MLLLKRMDHGVNKRYELVGDLLSDLGPIHDGSGLSRVSDEMRPLLEEIRRNPLLWLLVFVPIVLLMDKVKPESHTLLFVLSLFAILPLAVLLSHATESVAATTGDSVGGLLIPRSAT